MSALAMRSIPVVVVTTLMAGVVARAAEAPAKDANGVPAPLTWTAQQDHQNMMDQLGIKELRRGAEGMNRNSPYYQNTDESKANPYPNLPDPLVLKNGRKVTSAEMWFKQRRPEIVEDFDREVYGRVPMNVPPLKWEVTGTTEDPNGEIPTITKRLVGHVDNSACPAVTVDIRLTLTTPAKATGPVPVMMEFGFAGFGNRGGRGGFGGGWQQQVLAKGWGYAIIVPNSIQADNGAGLTRGIIGLCNKGQARKPDDWGALRAWAWGASRALDYFETDKTVDATQVGIEGLSRYVKAALVAMAYDQRFAIGFIGSSGEGGAKLHRRNWGELVENLTGSGEYHWMCGNFLKYGGPLNAGDLPVDAHELIAMCAPRPTFISYGAASGQGAEGTWVDQKGSFMAAVAAGPVYKLLGKKDLGTTGRDGSRRRRAGLASARRRPHHRPQLAHLPDLGRPLHQSPAVAKLRRTRPLIPSFHAALISGQIRRTRCHDILDDGAADSYTESARIGEGSESGPIRVL
jgi:hypothetical protein